MPDDGEKDKSAACKNVGKTNIAMANNKENTLRAAKSLSLLLVIFNREGITEEHESQHH